MPPTPMVGSSTPRATTAGCGGGGTRLRAASSVGRSSLHPTQTGVRRQGLTSSETGCTRVGTTAICTGCTTRVRPSTSTEGNSSITGVRESIGRRSVPSSPHRALDPFHRFRRRLPWCAMILQNRGLLATSMAPASAPHLSRLAARSMSTTTGDPVHHLGPELGQTSSPSDGSGKSRLMNLRLSSSPHGRLMGFASMSTVSVSWTSGRTRRRGLSQL